MSLPGLGVFPGRATGRAHLVDDPLALRSERAGLEVLLLPALWWPVREPLPTDIAAILLIGEPSERGPSVNVPVVARVDAEIVREGEVVEVNGTLGRFAIDGVEEVEVVTVFLERGNGDVLLLERSQKVGSFPGYWAGVSGFLEAPTPLEQAFREVVEETQLPADQLELAAQGPPVLARDGARVFVVHPFRFLTGATDVALNWEHVRSEWVRPKELRDRKIVPKLDRAWDSVAGPLPKG